MIWEMLVDAAFGRGVFLYYAMEDCLSDSH